MFKFLKDKLKSAVEKFSKNVSEEVEEEIVEKEEVVEEVKEILVEEPEAKEIIIEEPETFEEIKDEIKEESKNEVIDLSMVTEDEIPVEQVAKVEELPKKGLFGRLKEKFSKKADQPPVVIKEEKDDMKVLDEKDLAVLEEVKQIEKELDEADLKEKEEILKEEIEKVESGELEEEIHEKITEEKKEIIEDVLKEELIDTNILIEFLRLFNCIISGNRISNKNIHIGFCNFNNFL